MGAKMLIASKAISVCPSFTQSTCLEYERDYLLLGTRYHA
jgi:hypothetical protein